MSVDVDKYVCVCVCVCGWVDVLSGWYFVFRFVFDFGRPGHDVEHKNETKKNTNKFRMDYH